MEETLRAQIETYLSHLEGLIGRGQAVRDKLAADSSDPSVIAATRVWQEDCGVTINQLSGGSKAHWLARSFSQAFLMRSAAGDAVTGAAPAEIVQRLLGVLEQAVASLSGLDAAKTPASPTPRLPPRSAASPVRFRAQRENCAGLERLTLIVNAHWSNRTMTLRCALLAESWKPS